MPAKPPRDYKNAIQSSGKDIYAPIEIGDPRYWIPTPQLETLLNDGLRGLCLSGTPLRTRSKLVKVAVCEALGYPVPKSFRKSRPRFPGQQLDAYAQKSLNLQIWNEALAPTRRYAVIRITGGDVIGTVRVVTGQELARFDKTGTLTGKYQARLELGGVSQELISAGDTGPILPHVRPGVTFFHDASPIAEPESGALLPIAEIFNRLSPLLGQTFTDPGSDQERNRGAELHRLICRHLGYSRYEDSGRFPDIRHQLLEVKLQTSPTIDLGLVLPSGEDRLDVRPLGEYQPRHCDTRYVLFYAGTDGTSVTLTHLFVATGADFFTRFRRFEGRIVNRKIQIPLPHDFFDF